MKRLIVATILALFAASISCTEIINAASLPKFPSGELTAVLLSPAPHVNNAVSDTAIEITFDRPILPSSVTLSSFWAFGRWSGAADGTISFSNNDQTVTLTPNRPFSAGEQVMVILSHDLQAADGSPFRDAGLSYQFFVRAAPQPELNLFEIDEMTTRTNQAVSTRSYGGFATDLNEDGWMDITVVNEDSADPRTFLNRADSTGLFPDFLTPPTSRNIWRFGPVCGRGDVVHESTNSVRIVDSASAICLQHRPVRMDDRSVKTIAEHRFCRIVNALQYGKYLRPWNEQQELEAHQAWSHAIRAGVFRA